MPQGDPFAQYVTDESDPFAAYVDTSVAPVPTRQPTPAEATRVGTPPAGFSQPLPLWLRDLVLSQAPTIGMLLATRGASGIPQAAIRGLLGASGGEALKLGGEALSGRPPDFTEAATRMGGAATMGSLGGAMGGLGGEIVPAGRQPALQLAQRAYAPPEGIRASFPTVIEDILKAGIPRTPAGAARAELNVIQAARRARGIRSVAQKSGITFQARDFAGPALRAARAAKGSPLTAKEQIKIIRGVEQGVNEYLTRASRGAIRPPQSLKPSGLVDAQGNPIPAPPKPKTTYTPASASAVSRLAGKEAAPGYRAAEQGRVLPGGEAGDVAAGTREALERIPGHLEAQATLQRAIGVNRALKKAMLRPTGLFPAHLNFTRFPGISLRPDLASRMAIGAYRFPLPFQIASAIGRYGPQITLGELQALMDQPAAPDTTQ